MFFGRSIIGAFFFWRRVNRLQEKEGKRVPGKERGSEGVQHHRDRQDAAGDESDLPGCLAEYVQGGLGQPFHDVTSFLDLIQFLLFSKFLGFFAFHDDGAVGHEGGEGTDGSEDGSDHRTDDGNRHRDF